MTKEKYNITNRFLTAVGYCGAPKYLNTFTLSHSSAVSRVPPCPKHRHSARESKLYWICPGGGPPWESMRWSHSLQTETFPTVCRGWSSWCPIMTAPPFKSSPEHQGLSWFAAWWPWWHRPHWVSYIWEEGRTENIRGQGHSSETNILPMLKEHFKKSWCLIEISGI